MTSELPRVDLFAIGFLLGSALTLALCGWLHARELERIERRHAFGLRRHPAFRK